MKFPFIADRQEHMNNTCKATELFHLTNVRRIRRYLSTEATQTLV